MTELQLSDSDISELSMPNYSRRLRRAVRHRADFITEGKERKKAELSKHKGAESSPVIFKPSFIEQDCISCKLLTLHVQCTVYCKETSSPCTECWRERARFWLLSTFLVWIPFLLPHSIHGGKKSCHKTIRKALQHVYLFTEAVYLTLHCSCLTL